MGTELLMPDYIQNDFFPPTSTVFISGVVMALLIIAMEPGFCETKVSTSSVVLNTLGGSNFPANEILAQNPLTSSPLME